MKLLVLIFGDVIYKINSKLIEFILRKKGIKVGCNFYIQGLPKLKINGSANNIKIGNNVRILGDIDLRNRENGQIIIKDNVSIDDNCRFVAANDSIIKIGESTKIGLCTVFNAGESIDIGRKVLISGFCYIQSSNHKIEKDSFIQEQGHTYGKIKISDDVWLGSHVTILPNVTVGKGAIVGAKAVVSKNIKDYAINVGVPAKQIGERK